MITIETRLDTPCDFISPNRQFLSDTQACYCPIELYALWTAIHFGDEPVRANSNTRYPELKLIMPRASTELSIPTGYGADGMDLFILPDLIDIPLEQTSGDQRPGWEYGHTAVYKLNYDEQTGWEATCNKDHHIITQDVVNMINHYGIEQLSKWTLDNLQCTSSMPAFAVSKDK